MADERLGNMQWQPRDDTGGEGFDEAALDRYVVRERPVVEFVAAQAERSPWWAISLLVHLLVFLVLWKCPVRAPSVTLGPDPVPIGLRDSVADREVAEAKRPEDPEDVEVDNEQMEFTERDTGANVEFETKAEAPLEEFRAPVSPDVPQAPIWQPPIFALPTFGGDTNRPVSMIGPRRIPRPSGRIGVGRPGDPDGGHKGVRELVLALEWLEKAQERDGSWNGKSWDGAQPYAVGMTGLSLLAYLGAGYTHSRGQFKTTVGSGLRWLESRQRPDGSFPWTTFYEQGIATMAVCEAYAMTHSRRVGRMAQRAVDYICRVQPEHGGFRYSGPVARGEGDMSVTGWQIMAIKSALCSDLAVPPQALERSRVFLRNALRKYGTSSYIVSSPAQGSLAMTAAGTFCRMLLGKEGAWDDEIRQATTLLLSKETEGGKVIYGGATKQLVRDLYYTYYSSLAMFQAGPEFWKVWRDSYMEPLRTAMVRHKLDEHGRFVRGSWDPAKCRWGKAGGRIYATAMAVLSLEVPFRYLRIYRFGS